MRGIEQIPILYDAMMAVAEATGFGRWRRLLVEGAGGLTLDVGCGTGRNLVLYSSEVDVIGADVRFELLMAARRRAPGRPLVIASAEALPFETGVFHTVVSGLVFCSVPDPLQGLREVRRVLAPDGSLQMLEHVRSLRPLMGWWQDLIQPAWTLISGGCHPNRDTEGLVEEAGFTIDRSTRRVRRNVRLLTATP